MTALAALAAGIVCVAIILLVARLRTVAATAPPRSIPAELVDLETVIGEAASPDRVLEHLAAGCRERFSASRAVVFRLHDDAWRAVSGDAEGEVPALLVTPMAWFAHNPELVTAAELGGARFGAIGPALEKLLACYEINALMPLVDRRLVIAVIGLALPPLTADRRARLERLRRFSAAACANLRLHAEAAQAISLDREGSDIEGIKMALIPEPAAGATAVAEYASFCRLSGAIGSDFAVVRSGDGELWIAVGDAVGSGLAAALIAVAVKGAVDVTLQSPPEADAVLASANLPLDRPGSRARASCICARLSRDSIEWANAGHLHPYLLRGSELSALVAAGPLLGREGLELARHRAPLESGDRLVFLTNGVIDALGEGDDQRGHRRIQRLLRESGDATAGELSAAIAAACADRCPEPRDDETAVVVRVS